MSKRICWSYSHYLGGRGGSRTMIAKYGEFYGKVKHIYRYRGPQLAAVKFDGNKGLSKVPYYELEFLEDENETK